MAIISRWPVHRGGRYLELIAGLSDEGVQGGRYTEVTVTSRRPLSRADSWVVGRRCAWSPLYRDGRYIKVVAVEGLR